MKLRSIVALFTCLIILVFVTLAFTTNISHPSKKDIHAALHLIGLSFTPAEVDSLHDGVHQNLEDYQEMGEMEVSNDVPPALYFNPMPADFSMPRGNDRSIFDIPSDVNLPESKSALAWYTIPELASLIKSKQISCVELTQFFLDRLRKHDPTLQCVISYTEERALEQARALDQELVEGKYRGILHGIPYGAKDLLAVNGYKTTWGATPYKNQELDVDATVVQKLEEAGAVLIAKMTLGALAWGDVWYGGKTRNPWDVTTGSSGSSAGSASAVSAGLLPFALGTETLGSIVSPSTVCGTTGHRPTFGTVSKHGAMALSWSMDKIGPITRHAEDCAIVYSVIRGTDKKDISVKDAPFDFKSKKDITNLRVGFVRNMGSGDYGFAENDQKVLDKLRENGIELIPIELPDYPPITFILNAEAAAAFDDLTRSNQDDQLVRQIKNAWPNSFRTARLIPAVEYIQANRLRSQLIEQMNEVMQEVDVYLHPSWSSSSLRITNMTGHPCVVMPNGLKDGRPTSFTVTGKLYEDDQLLEFAAYIQSITEWDEMHPPMD